MIKTAMMMMIARPASTYVMTALPSPRVIRNREWVDLADTEFALDIGCGYGISTLELKEMTPHASVMGIDYDKSKIMTARRIVGERRADLYFEHKDAINTGLESNMFDLVQFKNVLCQVSHPGDMIGEARRLLRPGGLVIVYERIPNRSIDHLWKYFSGFDPRLYSIERDVFGLVLRKS